MRLQVREVNGVWEAFWGVLGARQRAIRALMDGIGLSEIAEPEHRGLPARPLRRLRRRHPRRPARSCPFIASFVGRDWVEPRGTSFQ